MPIARPKAPNADAEAERQAVYRKRSAGRRVELWDDLTGTQCAASEVSGKPVFARLEIESPSKGRAWRCEPNRRVMPTSWRLVEQGGPRVTVFSQRIAPKLLNPMGRRLLTVERSGQSEPFHVVDAREAGVGRLLGTSSSDWALVRGETPVASFGYARRPDDDAESQAERKAGFLGRLRGLARSIGQHDRALVSVGPGHALGPAEALVLLLLFESLTESE